MGWFKRNSNTPETGYHSDSYHRFFEGYSEVKTPKENGKGSRIVRTYTGMYYQACLTRPQWIRLKVLYTLLFLLSFSALAAFSFFRSPSAFLPVGILEAVSFFTFFIFLYFLILYLAAPRKMDVGTYKSAVLRLPIVSNAAAIILWILAAVSLAGLILAPHESALKGIACVLCAALSGGLMYGIRFIETRLVYNRERSKQETEGDAVEIS